MRVLFCHLRTYGDIIRTFPMLDSIKALHPDTYIGYTCYENMLDVCKLCKSIDSVYLQPRLSPVGNSEGGTRILNCSSLDRIVDKIRRDSFDVYVDLHGVFQSGLLGCLANINRRIGRDKKRTKDGAYLFYTDTQSELSLNKMERHYDVCRILFPDLQPPTIKSDWMNRDIITIFPGSSVLGILKRWPIKKYQELCNLLPETYRVLFAFGPEESALIDSFSDELRKESVMIRTWNEARSLIDKSRIVIGNDGAYLHMAIWRQTPTIMICGPTSYEINGVWKYGSGKNVFTKLCENKCEVWNGICKYKHICLENLEVSKVYSLVSEYL